ncbi:MAG: hydantoinase/oxoprolinase family protein [Candidatus Bathyarchaeum tardum]|nr:MAG: hydantoinase/oxoprolinase family protein [Candidatus Bathyarchaeum tardum]
MVNILGLDIGGANTKVTFLKTQEGKVIELKTILEYFPVWKNERKQLSELLNQLNKKLVNSVVLDGVGVTITAELSDAYQTKKEGINHVLGSVTKVFGAFPIFVLDVETNLLTVKDALKNYLKVSSANWAATGWLISKLIKNGIVTDVGSTTTSIIPVINGKVAAKGKTDLEKLQNGELVYSGSLRTNVATIVNVIPVKEKITPVSSELFAQSGDVHRILGNISESEYTVQTCDDRGKTKKEAMARLARVVSADTNMLSEEEIMGMAKFVYEKQVKQIADGLAQVYDRTKLSKEETKIVVTGMGRNFLAKKAAENLGFTDIIDMNEILGADASIASPSVGVALMVATRLEGKNVTW